MVSWSRTGIKPKGQGYDTQTHNTHVYMYVIANYPPALLKQWHYKFILLLLLLLFLLNVMDFMRGLRLPFRSGVNPTTPDII